MKGTFQVNDIITILKTAKASWFPHEKSADDAFASAVETAWRRPLPEDFRRILAEFGGGYLRGERTKLSTGTVPQLVSDWANDDRMDELPECIVFGHDGGGTYYSYYYYDPDNVLGFGEWAVFHVGMGDRDRAGSVYCGKTLTDVVEQILDGEDLWIRPSLGDAAVEPTQAKKT